MSGMSHNQIMPMHGVPRLGVYLSPQCLTSRAPIEWLNKRDLAVVDDSNSPDGHSRANPYLQ